MLDLLKGLDFEETLITWAAAGAAVWAGPAFRVRHDAAHAALGDLARAAARPGGASRWPRSPPGPPRATRPGARWPARPAICCCGSSGPIHFHHHARLPSPPLHLGAAGRPPGRDRHAAGDGLRGLPPAGRAADAARPGRCAAPPPSWCAPTAPTRCRSSSCATDKHYFFSQRRAGVRRLPDRERRAAAVRRSGRPRRRAAPAAGRAARLRRGPRAQARRGRRQRAAVPAVRGARAADDLPRRRGDPRPRRGSRWRAGRSARSASRSAAWARPASPPSCTRSARSTPRPPRRSSTCSSAAARARPSAASRWRWTRSTVRHGDDTLVVLARDARGRGPRRPALRPLLRAPGDVAVVHAPRPGHAQRADRVHGRQGGRAAARARRARRCRSTSPPSPSGCTAPRSAASGRSGKLIALGNPFFQIESLYRFNAKFFPRWEPRYLVYEGTFGLPRAGIAAMWAEGQLWKPALPPAPDERVDSAPSAAGTLTCG